MLRLTFVLDADRRLPRSVRARQCVESRAPRPFLPSVRVQSWTSPAPTPFMLRISHIIRAYSASVPLQRKCCEEVDR
jgi:hypothetical protein